MSEFDLIRRYFTWPTRQTRLAVGDDAALLDAQGTLAISTDALLEGRHFFTDVDPQALGHKALAVNLSDLAAMGAQPLAFTLALGLPAQRAGDDLWMQAFSLGMRALADHFQCDLIGGDTTMSPMVMISITVIGQLEPIHALLRSNARVGDDIYVSGCLGDAAYALHALQTGQPVPDTLRQRLERPTPRVHLGRALGRMAHAAIDISDGLAGDLPHLLQASGVGAALHLEAVPCSPDLLAASAHVSREQQWRWALAGGDDYELCFTAAPEQRAPLQQWARDHQLALTRVGQIESAPGLRYFYQGQPLSFDLHGFDHFPDTITT